MLTIPSWCKRVSSRLVTAADLCGAARASNKALVSIGPSIQWQHSYVAKDKTFCIYLAESEDDIRQHAAMSGIPYITVT